MRRFGQYFAEAVADPGADLDKDGQTSLLEAFPDGIAPRCRILQHGLARLRASEHALLDDNGDGLGTPRRLVSRHSSGEEGARAALRLTASRAAIRPHPQRAGTKTAAAASCPTR